MQAEQLCCLHIHFDDDGPTLTILAAYGKTMLERYPIETDEHYAGDVGHVELDRKKKPHYPASSAYYALAKSTGYGLQCIDNLQRLIELKFNSTPSTIAHFSPPSARVVPFELSETHTCFYQADSSRVDTHKDGEWDACPVG